MQFRVDEYKNKFMEVASYMGLLDTVHHAVHGLGYVFLIYLLYLTLVLVIIELLYLGALSS